jgi:hypothetical protein
MLFCLPRLRLLLPVLLCLLLFVCATLAHHHAVVAWHTACRIDECIFCSALSLSLSVLLQLSSRGMDGLATVGKLLLSACPIEEVIMGGCNLGEPAILCPSLPGVDARAFDPQN